MKKTSVNNKVKPDATFLWHQDCKFWVMTFNICLNLHILSL